VVLTETDWLKQVTPVYPLASQRLNEQGNVVIRAVIDVHGVPRQLKVHRSSGFPRLDDAALAAASQSRVKPRTENGVPFEFAVLMPYGFELDR
jgi:protein TonB